jgi:hypothetical protein
MLHWIIFMGWVGESCVVCDTHLFFRKFTQATLEQAGREKWFAFYSAVQCREAFHELGSRMSPSLILIDAVSSACWVKEKKKEK